MLTITNSFDIKSEARTDKNTSITAIYNAPWIRVSYFGNFIYYFIYLLA